VNLECLLFKSCGVSRFATRGGIFGKGGLFLAKGVFCSLFSLCVAPHFTNIIFVSNYCNFLIVGLLY
jgi:hypothetical protein